MSKKISASSKALLSCLSATLITGSILTIHYISDKSFIPNKITPAITAFKPTINSALAASSPLLADQNPLIGNNFKKNLTSSTSNPSNLALPNPPAPPLIPGATLSFPRMPGIIAPKQGTFVTGVILPNVAILSVSGKSHVVKVGNKSPLGIVESVDSTGVTIDGKHYEYERS